MHYSRVVKRSGLKVCHELLDQFCPTMSDGVCYQVLRAL